MYYENKTQCTPPTVVLEIYETGIHLDLGLGSFTMVETECFQTVLRPSTPIGILSVERKRHLRGPTIQVETGVPPFSHLLLRSIYKTYKYILITKYILREIFIILFAHEEVCKNPTTDYKTQCLQLTDVYYIKHCLQL